jgi:hypothetical protein
MVNYFRREVVKVIGFCSLVICIKNISSIRVDLDREVFTRDNLREVNLCLLTSDLG